MGAAHGRCQDQGATKKPTRHAIIAAVAAAYDRVVVTDNEKDFFDIEIVNPIRTGGNE